MALNDGVLADLGFDPITTAAVGSLALKAAGAIFGRTAAFQERQAYRDAGAQILAKIKALIPSLPKWIQQTVTDDREEFRQKMIRPDMTVSDYKTAIAWIEGRETAWQLMLRQGPESVVAENGELRTVQITPAQMIQKLGSRQAYENLLRAEAAGAVTTIDPSGAVVQTAPPAVPTEEAGFNLPVMLVAAGLLAWLLLGKK